MKNIFETYRKRLAHIGMFRSVVLGLTVAFLAVGVTALSAWAAHAAIPVTVGLTVGIGAAAFAVATPLFYYFRFRPTDKAVAARLDALGLDERSITMYECQNDVSDMAVLQRADAAKKISAVPKGLLKYSLTIPAVLLLLFGLTFAAGATTASVLAASVTETEKNEPAVPPEEETFTVTYKVYRVGTGSVLGKTVQEVKKGGFTETVTAVPANGYRFSSWVDGNMNPLANQNNPRCDVNVRADITVYALFDKADSPDPGDGSESGGDDGGEEGKREPQQGDDGQTDDDPDVGQGEGDQKGEGNSEPTGGENKNNYVIDGTQDYKEHFDREARENELADEDLPDELKELLNDYYDILKP